MANNINKVIDTLPDFVDHIIVVDDKCPQHSGEITKSKSIDNKKIIVLFNEKNMGVGGAVITGYKKALELKSDIVIKVDGDGQMNSKYIKKLIKPIINNQADYTKGNRFHDFTKLRTMPKIRLFGNSILSFVIKFASGHWDIMDPTNGFTAISAQALRLLYLNKISKRYFFEIDMLINLNINNCTVQDIPIPAQYGDEESSLQITNILKTFPIKIIKGFCKRIFYKYYIYDFNMASIYIILGLPLFIFGFCFGLYSWIVAITQNIENSAGTVMLSVLPIILGVQFLLQAISIDMNYKK